VTTQQYAGGMTRRQVIAWRNALFAIFALCGLAMSTWMSRVPSVRDGFGADTATMSILAFSIAVGSVLGLVGSAHIVARLGANRTILVAMIIGALGLTVAGFFATIGPNFVFTAAGLGIFGFAFGICDVAMNVSGAAQERVLGKPIMPIFHAFFSFGTMGGAALSTVIENVQISVLVHISVIAAVMVVVILFTVRHLGSEHLVGDGREETASAHGGGGSSSWSERLQIWRDPRTLLIGLIVLGMAFAEGSANDWLALAIVDGYDVANATGAFIFGLFVTAMTIGRLAGVWLLDRFGRVPVLRGTAILAIIGLLIVIFGQNIYVAGVGAVLWGLGASLGFPVGMSAAADDPKTAAARVSAVATIGYFAFLVGPPVIGLIGHEFGLLRGLLVVLVLIVIAGVVSGAAAPKARAVTGEADEAAARTE